MTQTTDYIIADSWGYVILIAVMAALIAVGITEVHRIRNTEQARLHRRSLKKISFKRKKAEKPERVKQVPEDCSAHCIKAFYYEMSIKELQHELEQKTAVIQSLQRETEALRKQCNDAEVRCGIMHSTISKLRTESRNGGACS